MLFIHGDKDSVVPVEMVHRLYEAKIGDKELWILSGVDHGAAYLHDPQIYAQRVRTFVEHWFECPAILEQRKDNEKTAVPSFLHRARTSCCRTTLAD